MRVHVQIEAMNIVGEIRGKHCIIVDDMIDTAGNNPLPLSSQLSTQQDSHGQILAIFQANVSQKKSFSLASGVGY